MLGLLTLLLLVAGCVEMEWETVVGSDGAVEHTTFRFITENEDLFKDAWNDLQSDLENERAEYETLRPYLQVSSHTDDNRYVIEVTADFEAARQSGIDLETYTRNSAAFDVFHEVLQGTGIDPETGLVYADYVFHPSEEFSDPLLRMLMADMGYTGPVVRTITHMPGEIVGDVGRNDVHVTLLTPNRVQTEVSLTELNRTVEMRIEAEPSDGQAADANPDAEAERTQDSNLVPVEWKAAEQAPSEAAPRGWEPFARSPEPRLIIDQGSLARLRQEPFIGSSRVQLTETLFVQDVTVHKDGLIGPEIVGEIINKGTDSFRWVGLGIAFFDANGKLIEYQTLMIPNVEAGQQRGFKKYLYKANIEEAVTYRIEWNYSF